MKTRLLKKVRKRYEIQYNERGIILNDHRCIAQYLLIDKYNEYKISLGYSRKEVFTKMIEWVKSDYPTKTNKNTKIYYNGI